MRPFESGDALHVISVVIPVYQGELTLESLVGEIELLAREVRSPEGHRFRIAEVVLVHDGAIDGSDRVMESLAARHPFVRNVWLSRNFGQHPATLAGMASTTAAWVVTLDEDGQHAPADIGGLLDTALARGAQLVYASPTNPPPHGWIRNLSSRLVKWISVHALGNDDAGRFSSFRLVEGQVARSLAAYCGNSVFLDVALSWVVTTTAHRPVLFRDESRPRSGYTMGTLGAHFARLLLTSGTRPLWFITLFGALSMVVAAALAAYAVWAKLMNEVPVQGWTSTIIVSCFFFGGILFSLGVIAQYLAVTLNIVMGRPLYLVVSRPPREAPPRS